MSLHRFATGLILALLMLTSITSTVPSTAIAAWPEIGAAQSNTNNSDAITFVPGTVAINDAVATALKAALSSARSELPPSSYYAVSALDQRGDWSFVSIVGLAQINADQSWSLTKDANWFGLVLLRRNEDGAWEGAVENTAAFLSLLAAVPDTVLSTSAKENLSHQGNSLSAETEVSFPWQAGFSMMYGARAVHPADFPGAGTLYWKAVDWVSDGNTALGHAPNHLLASTAGSISYVCNDGVSVTVRMGDILYAHLLNNSKLYIGRSFAQGEEMGLLKTGPFSNSCGWADQGTNWFHVHWAFPATTPTYQVEDWTLSFADAKWRAGSETKGVYSWFKAGENAASSPYPPQPISPDYWGAIQPGGTLTFGWLPVSRAEEYLVEWWGGASPVTQPCQWSRETTCVTSVPAAGYTYFWRVKARNAVGESTWSAPWPFHVQPATAGQPWQPAYLYVPLSQSTPQ